MTNEVEIVDQNDRGFHRYGAEPITTRDGHQVTVYESSIAFEGPHAWLNLNGGVWVKPASHDPRYDKTLDGWHVYDEGRLSTELSRPQARDLIARLEAWLAETETGRWDAEIPYEDSDLRDIEDGQ